MEDELNNLIEMQQKYSGWNFYNEREHVENLFYSRFNFFLVFYGMLIAAIATFLCSSAVKENLVVLQGFLFLGILVLLLMQYMLCNVHHTLQILLKLIDGLPSYHSSPIISSLRRRGNTGFLIAFLIPFFCISFLCFISCNYMDDNCTSAIQFLVFSGILILMFCLYNLFIAIRGISDKELREVINRASKSAEHYKKEETLKH